MLSSNTSSCSQARAPYSLIAQRAVRRAWSQVQHRPIEKRTSTTRKGIQKHCGDPSTRTNSGSHIDALHSRQALVNGERVVRAKSDKPTAKKKKQNIKTASTNRKLDPRRPKMAPEAPQNGPKRGLRGPKKRSQTARRKKNRTKTTPRPSWAPQGVD